MEEATDGHRLLLVRPEVPAALHILPDDDFPEAPIHIQAMLHQAAGVGAVIFGAGRGGEKVGVMLQPGQEVQGAVSGEGGGVCLFELHGSFVCHGATPLPLEGLGRGGGPVLPLAPVAEVFLKTPLGLFRVINMALVYI